MSGAQIQHGELPGTPEEETPPYERPRVGFWETFSILSEDNRARLKFMEKDFTRRNIMLSYLSPSMGAVVLFRLGHWAFCNKLELLSKLFYLLNSMMFGCEITTPSEIGPGLHIVHAVGTMVHAKIGKNATLYGLNGIGGASGSDSKRGFLGGPIIGDNLTMGHNAKILGPLKIGDTVFVGAMSMVTRDTPDNAYTFGIPAKVKRERTDADPTKIR